MQMKRTYDASHKSFFLCGSCFTEGIFYIEKQRVPDSVGDPFKDFNGTVIFNPAFQKPIPVGCSMCRRGAECLQGEEWG